MSASPCELLLTDIISSVNELRKSEKSQPRMIETMDINQFIKHISNKKPCFYMIILLQHIVFGEVHVILTRKIML